MAKIKATCSIDDIGIPEENGQESPVDEEPPVDEGSEHDVGTASVRLPASVRPPAAQTKRALTWNQRVTPAFDSDVMSVGQGVFCQHRNNLQTAMFSTATIT